VYFKGASYTVSIGVHIVCVKGASCRLCKLRVRRIQSQMATCIAYFKGALHTVSIGDVGCVLCACVVHIVHTMWWLRLVGSSPITGLFCKRALYKRRYSAKETCNFNEPTNGSHPIKGCHPHCDVVNGASYIWAYAHDVDTHKHVDTCICAGYHMNRVKSATPPKSTTSRNLDISVSRGKIQIQILVKFEFVP